MSLYATIKFVKEKFAVWVEWVELNIRQRQQSLLFQSMEWKLLLSCVKIPQTEQWQWCHIKDKDLGQNPMVLFDGQE